MNSILGKKRNRLSLTLIVAIGSTFTMQQAMSATGVFDMYDPQGALMNTDTTITGNVDINAGTWGVASTTLFSGLLWTASNGVVYGEGTHTVSTTDDHPCVSGTDVTFTVGPGQVGGHIKFAWGSTCGIDVVNVWDVSGNAFGKPVYTSTDWDGDGTLGGDMGDGPFPGFSANFHLEGENLSDAWPPQIKLLGDNPTTLDVGEAFTETATCSDDIEGEITETSGLFVIDASTLDVNTPGSYSITYDCQDTSGNTATQATRTVNVQAASVPVITLAGVNPLTFQAAASYTDEGASCNDAFAIDGINPGDGPITPVVTLNDVASVVPGSYSVVYECTDNDNETASATRVVNVVDTTAPTIALSATCPIAVMGGADFVDPTPTATASDIVDGNLTGSIVMNGEVQNPVFTATQLFVPYNLTYSVSDTAGNAAAKTCQVIVGNPTPVVTPIGSATVTLSEGEGYTDPGASCQDFDPASLSTPDVLTATADTSINSSTPAGTYTITYSCTDGDNYTGTATRTVVVAGTSSGGYTAAPITSASNFTMLNPEGEYVGGAADIYSNWDGSLLTSIAVNTANMTMGSAAPTPFFGDPWTAHTIRVFGPGSYTLTTTRGNSLSFTVGPNQVGAHMLFDWSASKNIDVAIVWNTNGSFNGNGPVSGQVFNLVSVDGDGDGFPGIGMADGPFKGFSANFNINFTPPYTLAAVQAPLLTASQGGNTTRTVLIGGGDVVVTASSGSSFDWSSSSGALLTTEVNDGDEAVFTFDPSGLSTGIYNVSVTIDDGSAAGNLMINVMSSANGLDVADDDNDGIPNHLDEDASGATPTIMRLSPGGGSIVASHGKLEVGDTAFASGADGVLVSEAEITATGGVADTASSETCIGGCFDFAVTGLTPGSAVQVVLPLSEAIPAGAAYRKLIDGAWRDFSVTTDDAIASAMSLGGVCPAIASADYVDELVAGNDCVRLTLADGGPNDADGLPNGIVRDPGGVAVAGEVETPVSTIGDPSTGGGCTLTNRPVSGIAGEWLLIGGLLAGLGLYRRRQMF